MCLFSLKNSLASLLILFLFTAPFIFRLTTTPNRVTERSFVSFFVHLNRRKCGDLPDLIHCTPWKSLLCSLSVFPSVCSICVVHLNGEPFSPLRAPSPYHVPSVLGPHSDQEAVGPLSALVVRLKCSLHRSPFTQYSGTAEKHAIRPSPPLPYIHVYKHKLIMKGRIVSRRADGVAHLSREVYPIPA